MVPAAHANDIAGSIRIPSAHCGLVGLKPSRGRVASGPRADPPIGLFSEGVITRSVRDTAGLLDAVTAPAQGADWPPPPLAGPLAAEVGKDPGRLRIALCVDDPTGAEVDAGCADAARTAAALLEAQGHDVREAAPPALFEPDLFTGARAVLAVAAAQALDEWAARPASPSVRATSNRPHGLRRPPGAGHGSGAPRLDGPPAAAGRAITGWGRRGHRRLRHAHDGGAAHAARRLPAGLRPAGELATRPST
jgi:amidase